MSPTASPPVRPARRVARALTGRDGTSAGAVIRHGLGWRWRRLRARWSPIASAAGRVGELADRTAAAAYPKLPAVVQGPLARTALGARLARRANAAVLAPRPGPGSSTPVVSVVVTSCDRSELLPVALRSVQLQDVVDLECVVVDDASTDDSMLVAREFVEADGRFRLIVHSRRLGVSASRNTGIAAAQGRYVCFLDDDDFLLEGSLRSRLERIVSEPDDTAGVICDWINTDPWVGLERFGRARRAPIDRGTIAFVDLMRGAPFIVSAPLLRRTVLLGVGGFDEAMTHAEDVELWGRILRLGYRFVDAVHVGVAYRRSPDSVVTAAPSRQLAMLDTVFRRWERPDASVAGHGPLPIEDGLGGLAARAAFAPQLLRYLALTAWFDLDEAVASGQAHLPLAVRSALDPLVLRRELLGHVRARLGLTDADDHLQAERAVDELLTALVPARAASWTRTVDVTSWTLERRDRGRCVDAIPTVVPGASLVPGAVVLIGEARYHIDELGPLAEELRSRGLPVCFMLSPKTVPAALAELAAYASEILAYAPEEIGRAGAVVVLNDWGPVRSLVELANEQGVPTFAKVEGVQDFDDVDTGRRRDPYRTASVVLAQGPNDVAALPGRPVEVVGSSRLETIWHAPAVDRGDHVLVNLNFTFRVLTEHRDDWMRSIAKALEAAGVAGRVSCHPAERPDDWGLGVATKPFRHEITRAGLLISRFSTVPFEAMARGVPFVYHNPHGERVPTFTRPDGAFDITTGVDDLADAVTRWLGPAGDGYRETSRSFFLQQVDVLDGHTSAERTADVLAPAIDLR